LSIGIGLLIVAAVIAGVRARGPVVSTAVAKRTHLEQRVIASGRVRAVTRIQLSAQVSGRVVTVAVVDGQRVRAGDLLVRIDDAEARAAVSQAQAAVSQASGRVEQLRKVGATVQPGSHVVAVRPETRAFGDCGERGWD
jgi:HlyD family secretion protein